MANHSRALFDLCACFRGSIPKRADWTSLLGLANQTLTTPALMEVVSRFERALPEDVCVYVREIYLRNQARNGRLAGQLAEAVKAINDCGVTPILLKGAAMLATASESRRGSRLMADLDIMISTKQSAAVLGRLLALGYTLDYQSRPEDEKWYVDLKRPSDVGMIDLHDSAPGPAFFYCPLGDLTRHCELTAIGEGSAYVPSATVQALMLIVHDQFQDHDYWIGDIDMRHLLDLRDLARSPAGIDWDRLAALAPSKLARNAVESQLVALSAMLGVDVPIPMRTRFIPRLQYRRRVTQARFPLLRWPLLSIALLDYANYRDGPGLKKGAGTNAGGPWRVLPKIDTLRWLLALSGYSRTGKF
jgi:Uncharacterised nucleotidyltransferase